MWNKFTCFNPKDNVDIIMFCLNLNFQPPQGLEPLIFQHLNVMFYFHLNKNKMFIEFPITKLKNGQLFICWDVHFFERGYVEFVSKYS
jgi:hypothetical protein